MPQQSAVRRSLGSPRRLALVAAAIAALLGLAVQMSIAASRKPPRPDLTVARLGNPPATLAVGAKLTAADTTKNRGRATAGKSTTRYYLSLDKKKSRTDALLGSRSVPRLRGGRSSKGRKAVTVPTVPAGAYYLLACADDRKKVRESNERNNCRSSTKTAAITATDPGPGPGPGPGPANAAPTVRTSGGALAYTEGADAAAVDPEVVVVDDGATLAGATVRIASGHEAADALTFSDQLGISGSYDTGTGVLTLTGSAPVADYEKALRSVGFRHGGDAPAPARTVEFRASDGSLESAPASREVQIAPVNDAPTVTATGGTLTYAPPDPVALDPGLVVADPDSAQLTGATVAVTSGWAQATDELAFVDNDPADAVTLGSDDDATGTLTLTGTASVAAYQAALRAVTYQSTASAPATRTASFTVSDGAATSAAATRQIAHNAKPLATDDSFAAVGNTGLFVGTTPPAGQPAKAIAGSVLANDSDPETAQGNLTATPQTDVLTPGGGRVTVEPDGNFTYFPPVGGTTSDTFTYTVSDGSATDEGMVTITLPSQVWYVSNSAAGNSGTSAAPFDTLAQAQGASAAGDHVFVFDGDNTTTGLDGGFTMKANQRLVGEGVDLFVADSTLYSGDAAKRPTLTRAGADVITLASGGQVRGLDVDPSGTGGGIFGTGVNGATIARVSVNDTATLGAQPGIELDGTSGTFNFEDVTVSTSGSTATGIRLNNAGTVNFVDAGTITIASNGAAALDAAGTTVAGTFDQVTATASGAGGVRLSGTAGVKNFGDGVGTDLSVTTASGAPAAFGAANAGTVNVAGGTAIARATGGPAIDVTGTAGTLAFDDVDSTGSANDGVNVDGLGAGTFSANSGTIGGYQGIGFDLNGGSGAVSFPGSFLDAPGPTVARVAGRGPGAGSVTFSGSIADTNDAGGGIVVQGNTGGSTSFTNASKVLNTLTADAVSFTTSDGHTLSLTGGGLDVDTTTGKGIEATASGTLQVTGSGNTIDTTTGRALNVTDTDIHANDLNFQRIASNGAPNGIVLSNTGNLGGSLVVAGNGGACTSAATCTGGAIQGSTGAGIDLTNVPGGASLTRMAVTGGQDDGIRATTVGTSGSAGLGLTSGFVSGNGNAVAERGLDYDNVRGPSSINSTTVTGSAEENARIDTDNGTLALTVSGSTFSSNSSTTGGDGITLYGDGNAVIRANVSGNTFSANRDDAFQLVTNGTPETTATMDLTFNNNSVNAGGNSGSPSAQSALNFDSAGSTTVKVAMNGGTVQGSDGSALILNPIGTSSFDAAISGVTIGTETALSGSETGIGIRAIPAQAANADIALTNNTIRNTAQTAMYLRHNDGAGTSDFTVTGNTISGVGSGFEAIWVQSGSVNTDTTTVCADIGGTSPALENTFAGVASGGATDIGFRRPSAAAGAHLKLPGFDGNMANLTAYVQNRNVGSPTVANTSGALEAGPASCEAPAAPTLP